MLHSSDANEMASSIRTSGMAATSMTAQVEADLPE